MGKEFRITEDTLTPMLNRMSSPEINKAKRQALSAASKTFTRAAVSAFRNSHASRSGRVVRHKQKRITWGGQGIRGKDVGAVFVGGKKRSVAATQMDKEGGFLYWGVRFVLDWFEHGTEDRHVRRVWCREGKYRRGQRSTYRRERTPGYRGRIEAESFVVQAISAKFDEVRNKMQELLARALYRIASKK